MKKDDGPFTSNILYISSCLYVVRLRMIWVVNCISSYTKLTGSFAISFSYIGFGFYWQEVSVILIKFIWAVKSVTYDVIGYKGW